MNMKECGSNQLQFRNFKGVSWQWRGKLRYPVFWASRGMNPGLQEQEAGVLTIPQYCLECHRYTKLLDEHMFAGPQLQAFL
jgi:hypothetical protein